MSTISLLERYGRAPSGAHVACLVCRACGHETPVEATNICERCFGPLEVRYDYEEVARRISRESIASGPSSIWRYRDLLPVDLEETEPITLGEGFTPLIHARNLGAELGLRNLYLKNDTQNPTGSFAMVVSPCSRAQVAADKLNANLPGILAFDARLGVAPAAVSESALTAAALKALCRPLS